MTPAAQDPQALDPAGVNPAEVRAMDRALELAAQGVRGANPLVGAVVLSPEGQVLGSGYHRGAGTPHAEVAALADARSRGADPAGGTMVVTLEPCNHQGRTGPCSAAIHEAGIRRVVFAAPDRTAQAAGGARWLQDHGIECDGGLRQAQSEHLNGRWLRATAESRPFVTLKTASSLDGRVAAADGTSQWITGSRARADGHAIRARVDAVLAGTGTVLADDPRLTARPVPTDEAGAAGDAGSPPPAQPLRAVMGLRPVPQDAAVRGPGFLQLATHDVPTALAELHGRGVRHVLVEGGPGIAGAFLAAGTVDELVSYIAPVVLGEGTPMFPPVGVPTLAAAHRWVPDPAGGGAVTQLGPDVRLRLRPADGDDGDAGDGTAADRTAAASITPASTTAAASTSAGTATGIPVNPSTPQHNQE
ncbi:bifunctional diaminohydroxyphosphoribosylaminopyrimidine deaminase/5-amino-6-(5-phosphoribosylamino)uracil reductase RibD [Arthrobacter zhaoguopingii]|uniref:bifunctional diaminohydroxyphosphoribosylaminopyrimidine deaminase/5-amino-6-(5-phosphoribosylamino)uracil reductase RibD n=1 Tax=Arthrobacter zhaoguopingii TaxID=2681491 RepID=UPI001FE2AFEA|nr:bifunctional diaminohydroxyphosphoribosylaminopyrimidine deaminase/5-amino-6-(5-phosphoribosylamino)uracil reductase RibD [Arthrobacter zhaoguopingii]